MLTRRSALALTLVLALAACAQPTASSSFAPVPRDAPAADTGITLAENAGPTLLVLSLDPGAPGENSVLVALRDPGGKVVPGSVRVTLALEGDAPTAVALSGSAGDRRGTLVVPGAGHATLTAQIVDGPSAGGSVTFRADLPVEPTPPGFLGVLDRSMNALRTLRETQTLASVSVSYLFRYEYVAPDRVRYTFVSADGRQHETRIIGPTRFDRDTGSEWSTSDLGLASRVPNFSYADRSYRVRVIGREREGAQDLLVVALVQRGSVDLHYRLWVGARDHLVRRYVMMALGHYMSGTYGAYDAAIDIAAPGGN